MGLIREIKLILKHFFLSGKVDAKDGNIEENTIRLRLNNESDISRWKNSEQLFKDWNDRTSILGGFIKPNAQIIEFGAGNMYLKEYLKEYGSYTPSDIVKRFDETIVCDLNKPISFDLSKFDVVVFSGVLEYVYDIDSIFNQLKSNGINQIVMSYSCADIVTLSRVKNGWLSDYTKIEIEKIIEKYNYKIQNYNEWRKQSIYNLISINHS